MNPFNNLQQWNHGGNVTNALMQGVQFGDQIRQQKEQRAREQATDEAYRGMIAGDPNAVNALAQVDPQSAYKLQQSQQAQMDAAKERQIRIDVAEGRAAPSALAGINWDDYAAMSKEQADIAKQNVETIGQLALMADTPQKWDAVIDQLGPQFAQYKGQFAQREAVIARSGQVKAFLEQNAPKYMAVPEGAELVNVRDPAALKAYGEGQTAESDFAARYEALPQGAQYTHPDGSTRIKGGAGSNASGGF